MNAFSQEDWLRRYQEQARWTLELRRRLYNQLEIKDARRVLEVGCGTGAITSGLHAFTLARSCGIDLRMEALSLAQHEDPDSEFASADGLALPFADGSFDFALCHFYLLWVADARVAMAEMARVTRAGGWVLALAEPDYAGRIDYPEALAEIGRLQAEALAGQGANPNIGRSLGGLMSRAGLGGIHTGLLGGQWSGLPSPDAWESEWDVLENDLRGKITAQELYTLRELDREAWQRGERVLFVPTFYAWGQVP